MVCISSSSGMWLCLEPIIVRSVSRSRWTDFFEGSMLSTYALSHGGLDQIGMYTQGSQGFRPPSGGLPHGIQQRIFRFSSDAQIALAVVLSFEE